MRKKKINIMVFIIPIIVLAIAVLPMLADAISALKPEEITKTLEGRGEKFLAVKDWMEEKNLNSIMLLNKSNRSYGTGTSIMVGNLNCYFDGPGIDRMYNAADLLSPDNMMTKAYELEEIANETGVYAYILQEDFFEIKITGDPTRRLAGMEGTPVYYLLNTSKFKPNALDIQLGQSVGGGWFLTADG